MHGVPAGAAAGAAGAVADARAQGGRGLSPEVIAARHSEPRARVKATCRGTRGSAIELTVACRSATLQQAADSMTAGSTGHPTQAPPHVVKRQPRTRPCNPSEVAWHSSSLRPNNTTGSWPQTRAMHGGRTPCSGVSALSAAAAVADMAYMACVARAKERVLCAAVDAPLHDRHDPCLHSTRRNCGFLWFLRGHALLLVWRWPRVRGGRAPSAHRQRHGPTATAITTRARTLLNAARRARQAGAPSVATTTPPPPLPPSVDAAPSAARNEIWRAPEGPTAARNHPGSCFTGAGARSAVASPDTTLSCGPRGRSRHPPLPPVTSLSFRPTSVAASVGPAPGRGSLHGHWPASLAAAPKPLLSQHQLQPGLQLGHSLAKSGVSTTGGCPARVASAQHRAVCGLASLPPPLPARGSGGGCPREEEGPQDGARPKLQPRLQSLGVFAGSPPCCSAAPPQCRAAPRWRPDAAPQS